MNKLILIGFFAFPILIWAGPSSSKKTTNCRAQLARVACVTRGYDPEIIKDPRQARKCLGGEQAYALELGKVYDELPPKLQTMFCHIQKIYIEEEMDASAYANSYPEIIKTREGDQVRLRGYVLGLSRSKIFDKHYSLSAWANQKEQLLFGRPMQSPLLSTVPKLEIVYQGTRANPLLLATILHELGHMVAMANGLITTEPSSDSNGRPVYGGLWSSISWLPDGSIKPEDRYYLNYRPCYYECKGATPLSAGEMNDMYRGFLNSNSFVSTYASVDPAEDFAESFYFYLSEKYFSNDQGSKYFYSAVTLPGEEGTNLDARTYSGKLKLKMEYMAMLDAMKWKYEVGGDSMPIKDYLTAVKEAAALPKE